MAGSRMLTADVFALTTRVDRQVTARTPRAPATTEVSLTGCPLAETPDEQRLGDHHLLDLGRVHALVGRVDPCRATWQNYGTGPGGESRVGWAERDPPGPGW